MKKHRSKSVLPKRINSVGPGHYKIGVVSNIHYGKFASSIRSKSSSKRVKRNNDHGPGPAKYNTRIPMIRKFNWRIVPDYFSKEN